MFPWTLLGYNV